MATKNESNKGDSKGVIKGKGYVTIDLDRYKDLLLSEEALKELYSYEVNTQHYDSNKNRNLQVEFVKNESKIFLPGWQKGAVTFYSRVIFTFIKVILIGHNKSLRFNNKRNQAKIFEGILPKPRKRKAKKKEAFLKWVKDKSIDPFLTLDRLTEDVDEAYRLGNIKIKIGRDTVRKCLPSIRKKS